MSILDKPYIASSGKRDVYYFTVSGYGEFPWDMLRYDSAFPAHGEDVANMLREGERREIRLGCIQRHGPTSARWESFGWRVKA